MKPREFRAQTQPSNNTLAMQGDPNTGHLSSRIEDVVDQLDVWREQSQLRRARNLARVGRQAQALEALDARRYRDAETRLDATVLRAKVLAQQGRIQPAHEAFLEALTLNPSSSQAAAGLLALENATRAPISLYLVDRVFKLVAVLLVGGIVLALIGNKLRVDQQAALAPLAAELSAVSRNVDDTAAYLARMNSQLEQRLDSGRTDSEQRLSELHAMAVAAADDVASLRGELDASRSLIEATGTEHQQAHDAFAQAHAEAIARLRAEWIDFEALNAPIVQAGTDLARLKVEVSNRSRQLELTQNMTTIEHILARTRDVLSKLESATLLRPDDTAESTREALYTQAKQVLSELQMQVTSLSRAVETDDASIDTTAP